MQIKCCIFSQVNSASIYNNRNLLLGLLNENSPHCLCFPAWAVSFQLFCALSSRVPKRFCGGKEALRKKKNQEWEIIVRITQQDGWIIFCPCFSRAKPLQCLKLGMCLSILLIWGQNSQNCIWLVPPNLLLKELQSQSAPTISWAHLVQTQPFPSTENDFTLSTLENRGWKVKYVEFFFREQRSWKKKRMFRKWCFSGETGLLLATPVSQDFVTAPWAWSHLGSSEYKAAQRLAGL